MSARSSQQRRPLEIAPQYRRFARLDGSHPSREHAPGSFVTYRARLRHGGQVLYFNFRLAKEMGLIPADHPHEVNPELISVVLDTFGMVIINEYDMLNNRRFRKEDIKPHQFMATRYLQMQHASRTGLTSGDGRSIWNGTIKFRGVRWDVSSCGTGATCLSPASANNNLFYQSGDPSISYGCGYAELQDAVGNAVFSEIIHLNGIKTERTLAIIEYPGSTCITVRAGKNLMRPSHFFNHLKQGRHDRLKGMVDVFIARNVENGLYPRHDDEKACYEHMLKQVCADFASIAAQFERLYLFCWLDWEGDNILVDGGIIDYGSVRQFGLYHHDYKFDDVQRWSTKIKDQKQKARYTVQVFVQLVDFLLTKRRLPLEKYRRHSILKTFDVTFEYQRQLTLLKLMGLPEKSAAKLLKKNPRLIKRFAKAYDFLERQTSQVGEVRVPDGVTCHAIYNMRALLALLADGLAGAAGAASYEPDELLNHICSKFATARDRLPTPQALRCARDIQFYYKKVIAAVVNSGEGPQVLAVIRQRAALINCPARITGDAVSYIGEALTKNRKKFENHEFHQIIEQFVASQVLNPDCLLEVTKTHSRYINWVRSGSKLTFLKKLQSIIEECREGL